VVTTAVDKWLAYARLSAVAQASHLPTAPTPSPGTRPCLLAWIESMAVFVGISNLLVDLDSRSWEPQLASLAGDT